MVGLQGSVPCTQLLRVLAALLAIRENGYLLYVPGNIGLQSLLVARPDGELETNLG